MSSLKRSGGLAPLSRDEAPAAWACAGLVVCFACQVVFHGATAVPSSDRAGRSGVTRLSATPLPDDAQLLPAALFAPDRRFSAAGAEGGGSGAASSQAGLAAVAVASGAGFSRVIIRTPDGKTQSLGQGAQIDGWLVAAIRQDDVVLAKAGQKLVLKVGAPAQASPAAAQEENQ